MKKYLPNYKHLVVISQSVFYFSFLMWLRYLPFRARVIRHKSHNRIKHKKLDRPVIIVGNHISKWDGWLLLSAMNKWFTIRNFGWRLPLHYKFYEMILFKWFFYALGVYPIKGKGDLKKSLSDTIEVINGGASTIFFPQGKRASNKGEPPVKKGIGFLLKEVEAYILPVHIDYSKRKKSGFEVNFGKTEIVFGELIKSEHFVEKYPDENRHEMVMEKVWELSRLKMKKIKSKNGVVASPQFDPVVADVKA